MNYSWRRQPYGDRQPQGGLPGHDDDGTGAWPNFNSQSGDWELPAQANDDRKASTDAATTVNEGNRTSPVEDELSDYEDAEEPARDERDLSEM